MQWTSWVAALVLVGLAGLVVWSSLGVGSVRCEVCVTFEGRQACRTVDAATEDEARIAAQTNACALLTSGVTRSMACQRTDPTRTDCRVR